MLTRSFPTTFLFLILSIKVGADAKPTKSSFFFPSKQKIEKGRILVGRKEIKKLPASSNVDSSDVSSRTNDGGREKLLNVRGGGIVDNIPTQLKSPGNIGLAVATAGTIHAGLAALWPTTVASKSRRTSSSSSSTINYFIRVTGMIRTFYFITLIGSVFIKRISTTNEAVGMGLVPLAIFHVLSILTGQPQKAGFSSLSLVVNMIMNAFCCYAFLTNAPYSGIVMKIFAVWNLMLGLALTVATEKTMKFRGLAFDNSASCLALKSVLRNNVGIHTLFTSFLVLALSEYSGDKGDLITAFAVFFVPLKKRYDNVVATEGAEDFSKLETPKKEDLVFDGESVVLQEENNASTKEEVPANQTLDKEESSNDGIGSFEDAQESSLEKRMEGDTGKHSLPLASLVSDSSEDDSEKAGYVNYAEYVNYTVPSTNPN